MHIGQIVMMIAAMTQLAPPRIAIPKGEVPLAQDAECQLAGLADSADVRVYLNRNATVGTRFSLGDGGSSASTIRIGADAAGPPFVLVLGAAKDMIWDFRGFPAHRLVAVVTLGERRHAVANLPRSVPVRFGTPQGPGSPCYYMTLLGQVVSTTEGDEGGRKSAGARIVDDPDSVAINVDGGPPPRPDPDGITLDAIRTDGPVTRYAVAPGIPGMIELLASGAIRYATQADADAWLAAHDRAGLPKRGFGPLGTYVVTRTTELPRDIGFRPGFILPPGVPRPNQPHGQYYEFYLLEDGTCTSC
ncbi:MAG: hypothetical protein ABIS51_11360 [Sphingomonas sp.]